MTEGAGRDAGLNLDTVVGYSPENGVYGFENQLVYSAASLVVNLDLSTGAQKFWQLGDRVTALAFVEASFTESPYDITSNSFSLLF